MKSFFFLERIYLQIQIFYLENFKKINNLILKKTLENLSPNKVT